MGIALNHSLEAFLLKMGCCGLWMQACERARRVTFLSFVL